MYYLFKSPEPIVGIEPTNWFAVESKLLANGYRAGQLFRDLSSLYTIHKTLKFVY